MTHNNHTLVTPFDFLYTHPYNKLPGKLCSMSIIKINVFRKTPLSFLLVYQTPSKTLWYNWLVPQFFIIIKMRGKELSPQQREQIIGAHISGAKGRVIAEK